MIPKSENDQSDLSLKIRLSFYFFHIWNEKLSNIKNKQIVETLLLTSHGQCDNLVKS